MLRELRAENRSCRLVPHRCFRAGAVGERARAGRAEVRSRPDGIVVLLWKGIRLVHRGPAAIGSRPRMVLLHETAEESGPAKRGIRPG